MFIVVFRNRKRPDIDEAAYLADAMAMYQLAVQQPGFVSFKSYAADDGEVIALSEWANAEAARNWGSQPDHAMVQARGRAEYYHDYTLYTCDEPRTHRYERPTG